MKGGCYDKIKKQQPENNISPVGEVASTIQKVLLYAKRDTGQDAKQLNLSLGKRKN